MVSFSNYCHLPNKTAMFLTCRHDCLLDFAANIAKKKRYAKRNHYFFRVFRKRLRNFLPKKFVQ
jgi:hypothetical protein